MPTVLVGCSADDDSAVLQQLAPKRTDVESEAGIVFPESTESFRLVRLGPTQIDVSFTIANGDVGEFSDGSGIALAEGERSLTHASPLWDVAVLGPVKGGSADLDGAEGVTRSAEVLPDVPEAGTSTVRLSILTGAGE